MRSSIEKLFAEYERAFNALEVEKQVPFFAEHFISAGSRGSIAQGRDEFARMASKAAEFYRASARRRLKSSRWKRPPSAENIPWSKSTGDIFSLF